MRTVVSNSLNRLRISILGQKEISLHSGLHKDESTKDYSYLKNFAYAVCAESSELDCIDLSSRLET